VGLALRPTTKTGHGARRITFSITWSPKSRRASLSFFRTQDDTSHRSSAATSTILSRARPLQPGPDQGAGSIGNAPRPGERLTAAAVEHVLEFLMPVGEVPSFLGITFSTVTQVFSSCAILMPSCTTSVNRSSRSILSIAFHIFTLINYFHTEH